MTRRPDASPAGTPNRAGPSTPGHPPAAAGRATSATPAPTLPAASALLARTRGVWRRAVLLRAVAFATAVLVCAVAALLLADLLVPLPAAARRLLRPLPFLAGAAPLLVALRRILPGPDDRRLALLVEERAPALENTLATALEVEGGGPVAWAFRARAERRLATVDAGALLRPRIHRPGIALGAGALAVVLALAVAPGGPDGVWRRWRSPVDPATSASAGTAAGPTEPGPVTPVPDPRFGDVAATIRPPAYTGLPPRTWAGDGPLAALPGSRIRVRGSTPAGAAALRAHVIGGGEPAVRREDGAWSVAWTVAPGDRGLSLEAVAGGDVIARRVVAVTPLEDHAPVVELRLPAEDLVAATPSGVVVLRASARDDHGVDAFHIAWIRSRGSGESFAFEEGEWAWDRVRTADGALGGEYALDLAAAGLEPGDVLHLRAIAHDRNSVTGPGVGVSATRVIRIAQPGRMDEATTLIGFPIEAEKNPVLSQRMIILLTERLRDRAPSLDRAALLGEAGRVADQQGRLRSRVGDQIFTRATGAMQAPGEGIAFEETAGAGHAHGGAEPHPEPGATAAERLLEAASQATGLGTIAEIRHDHDGDPIIAVNQPLVDAYNAMWAAERALRQGEPIAALPHQYEALRILQAQRQAERVFLRGRQAVAPVDVAAARGTGKLDDATPAPRSPGEPAPSAAGRLAGLEEATLALRDQPPRTAALALADLAAQLLADPAVDPQAAALVARAAESAGRGEREAAALLLLRARAALAPGAAGGTAPPVAGAVDALSAEYFGRLGGGRR